MNTTWNEAREKIIAEADNYGDKAEDLKRVAAADLQRDEVKNVINQLSDIIDPKCVHWTIRVARVIGEIHPAGQIAEFLGDGVVEALWGNKPAA